MAATVRCAPPAPSSFVRLAQSRAVRRYCPLRFDLIAFDLLVRGGMDIRLDGLEQRKQLLKRLLPGSGAEHSPILYADHVEERGIALFDCACELDLEGVVAKRKTSPYSLVDKR